MINLPLVLPLAITVLTIMLLLYVSELMWRRSIDTEYTRKFAHITAGSFVAFWPLFLHRNEIVLLSSAFVLAVAVSGYLNLFKAVHSVQRPTWGELFFAMAVGILAFVAHSHWIYSVALLHMALADGLAAVMGTKFGKRNRYHIFGHPKSVTGTVTFFVVSLAILLSYSLFTPLSFSVWYLALAAGAALLENVAIRGFDNLLVPLLVAVALNVLH